MQVVVKLPELNLVAFLHPPAAPARQGREGAVGLLVSGQHLEQNGPDSRGFSSQLLYSMITAGWRWRLSCLKFWLTQTL